MDLGSLILGAVGGASLVMAGEYAGGMARRLRDQRRRRQEDGKTEFGDRLMFARPPRGVKTGGSHNFELPAHLEDKVRSISRQQKTPMIAVVRAAVWLLKDNITHEAIIALDDMACTPEENNQ